MALKRHTEGGDTDDVIAYKLQLHMRAKLMHMSPLPQWARKQFFSDCELDGDMVHRLSNPPIPGRLLSLEGLRRVETWLRKWEAGGISPNGDPVLDERHPEVAAHLDKDLREGAAKASAPAEAPCPQPPGSVKETLPNKDSDRCNAILARWKRLEKVQRLRGFISRFAEVAGFMDPNTMRDLRNGRAFRNLNGKYERLERALDWAEAGGFQKGMRPFTPDTVPKEAVPKEALPAIPAPAPISQDGNGPPPALPAPKNFREWMKREEAAAREKLGAINLERGILQKRLAYLELLAGFQEGWFAIRVTKHQKSFYSAIFADEENARIWAESEREAGFENVAIEPISILDMVRMFDGAGGNSSED